MRDKRMSNYRLIVWRPFHRLGYFRWSEGFRKFLIPRRRPKTKKDHIKFSKDNWRGSQAFKIRARTPVVQLRRYSKDFLSATNNLTWQNAFSKDTVWKLHSPRYDSLRLCLVLTSCLQAFTTSPESHRQHHKGPSCNLHMFPFRTVLSMRVTVEHSRLWCVSSLTRSYFTVEI